MSSLKIAHFTSGDITGGAARGAYFLHQSIEKYTNIKSLFYIAELGDENRNTKIRYLNNSIQDSLHQYRNRNFEKYLLSYYEKEAQDLFSIGLGSFDKEIIEISKQVDIVHLHWINDQMLSLEAIKGIKVPIVWTFRDMWPFTGGCHYSKGCNKYISLCGNCPILKSEEQLDLSKIIYEKKLNNITKNNLYPVALSNWVKECAENSYLFSDKNIFVIPNCIDTNVFKIHEKKAVRMELALPINKKIILYGAINSFADQRKGFKFLKEALEKMRNKNQYYLITFGGEDGGLLMELGFQYTHFGKISDDKLLSKIYSSADVFVAPSIEEAFGKTIAEAMSSGTPVVAFDSTGPKDIITHKIDGYLAEPYNSNDLLLGIDWIVQNEKKDLLNQNARKKIEKNYSSKIIARKYEELYKEILEDSSNKIVLDYTTDMLKIKNTQMKSSTIAFEDFLEKQINQFNKWYIFDVNKIRHLRNQKIAIYGTGSFGRELLEVLNSYQIQVDCFIDSSIEKQGKYLDNIKIKNVEECSNHFIFVASTWFEEIEQTLLLHRTNKNSYLICMK